MTAPLIVGEGDMTPLIPIAIGALILVIILLGLIIYEYRTDKDLIKWYPILLLIWFIFSIISLLW